MLGVGASWDDSENSGLILYSSAGVSATLNNSFNAKDEILAVYEIPNYAPTFFPGSFSFDEGKWYYGASSLLGFRQDFEVLKTDNFINIEWFHTFGDWVSGNKGVPYTGNINQMDGVRNDSYFVNFGHYISAQAMVQITYNYIEFEETLTFGGGGDVPVEDFIAPRVKNSSFWNIIFTYKF